LAAIYNVRSSQHNTHKREKSHKSIPQIYGLLILKQNDILTYLLQVLYDECKRVTQQNRASLVKSLIIHFRNSSLKSTENC